MTKKDYIRIANLFAGEVAVNKNNPPAALAVRALILGFADIAAQDNPRFNREVFYVASGLRTE